MALTDRYRDLSQKSRIGHRMATSNVAHAIRISGAAKLTQCGIDFATITQLQRNRMKGFAVSHVLDALLMALRNLLFAWRPLVDNLPWTNTTRPAGLSRVSSVGPVWVICAREEAVI